MVFSQRQVMFRQLLMLVSQAALDDGSLSIQTIKGFGELAVLRFGHGLSVLFDPFAFLDGFSQFWILTANGGQFKWDAHPGILFR